MRTIQVINSKWFNATAWYAMYLTKILNDNRHESLVLTTADSHCLHKLKEFGLKYEIIPLNSNSPREIFQSWKMVYDLFKDFKPELVNCHRGESFYLFGILKKIFGYKLVRTRGDQRLPNASIFNKILHNNIADCLITTNTAMTKFFIGDMGTDISHIHTILGGVDTGQFYPQKENKSRIREEYRFKDDDILMGIVGRLDPIKGFHETIYAFEEAIKMDKSILDKFHLLIIGRDCSFPLNSLKEFSVTHGIPQENIHFYSYIPDINSLMNMLDVGIVSSLGSETIARVAFEMLACHTPIIGSRVGVMPDILDKEYLFAPGNIKEMAVFFHKVLDKEFRDKLWKSSMQRFYGNGDIDSIYGWTMNDFYQKTMHVYEQLFKTK